MKNLTKEAIYKLFAEMGVMPSQVSTIGDFELIIDLPTLGKKENEGLQILVDFREPKPFEFSEYQAGKDQNELHVFGEYKSLKTAIKRFLKGKPKPIKIWR